METVACSLVTLNSSEFILQSPFAIPILLLVLILLLLALISVSGAELAFLSIPQSARTSLERNKSKNGEKLISLLSNPEKLMATLVVANVFIKVGLIVISFFLTFTLIQPGTFSDWIIISLIVIGVLAAILFCELTPKVYAIAQPEKYLLATGYWIYLLEKIFGPIAVPFQKVLVTFNHRFASPGTQISVNDLTEAIENSSDPLSEEEEILKGIVKFGAIDVSEILRPRIDVVAVDMKMTLKQVLAIVVDSGYSRIPVYAGNFDNVKGILFVKDLLPHINGKDDFHWQSLIRPPYFVPDTKKVKELLTEFQTSKNHLAVVVDEYGGTLGIVTLEDILEEIVGEISDESDEDEKSYTQINRNIYIFDGKTLLNDFYKILQIETTVFEDVKGDADTLAGLLLELKGAIPAKNEQINYKQFTFKIESVDSRRIKQIRVTINNS